MHLKTNLILGLLLSGRARTQDAFDWSRLTSSTSLAWVSCYTKFQCTKLQVPLNYFDPSAGDAALALIRIPSSLPPSDPDYRGPVLFNPGGPGLSGVDQVIGSFGPSLASIVGPEFDIVSFDPRGVSRSTPRADFLGADSIKSFWDSSLNSGSINTTLSTSSIPRLWSQSQVLGRFAQAHDTGILQHITTDNVARDMLSIVQAHNETKLKYWGISYGSVLGAMFATLFPDKIERMVIDGVLDMDVYFSGRWDPLLRAADTVLQMFYNGCFAAGPSACPFYASPSSQIHANVNALLDSVTVQPIPVHMEATNTYGIVDGATLKSAIRQSLYFPFTSFPILAKGLAELARGNGTTILSIVPTPSGSCNAPDRPNMNDAAMAILCADFFKVTDSPNELQVYFDDVKNVSTFVDTFVLPRRIYCSGWQIHPNAVRGPLGGNTSFPLLLIGNTADPVSPVQGAVKTSSAFSDSVVLVQDSPGHTSFAAQSVCTSGYVRAYFLNGTFPSNGTVCPIQSQLFSTSV
ncbi:TAP-like protein-domain-containing protein [Mycena crocata]|nr:TAP-like protein-domain-containing protein [Mycena crocata]